MRLSRVQIAMVQGALFVPPARDVAGMFVRSAGGVPRNAVRHVVDAATLRTGYIQRRSHFSRNRPRTLPVPRMKELPTFLKEFASQGCRFLIRWIQTRPTRERRFRVLTVSMERWIAVAAMGSVSVKTAREQNLPSAPIVPARVKLCVTVRLPAISTCVYK